VSFLLDSLKYVSTWQKLGKSFQNLCSIKYFGNQCVVLWNQDCSPQLWLV
jgi:hypothetical protein